MSRTKLVPSWVRKAIDHKEHKFKKLLQANLDKLSVAAQVASPSVSEEGKSAFRGKSRAASDKTGQPSKTTRRNSARGAKEENKLPEAASPSNLLHTGSPVALRNQDVDGRASSNRPAAAKARFRPLAETLSPIFASDGKSGEASISTKSKLANAWENLP